MTSELSNYGIVTKLFLESEVQNKEKKKKKKKSDNFQQIWPFS